MEHLRQRDKLILTLSKARKAIVFGMACPIVDFESEPKESYYLKLVHDIEELLEELGGSDVDDNFS